MAQELKGGLDGHGLRVGVIVSQFNETITSRLLQGAREALTRHGVPEEAITIVWVPGSMELPPAAQRMAKAGRWDALIALGCVIRGETAHFDFVAGEAARGIAEVARETGVPVSFGVLTPNNMDQAMARAGGAMGNRGYDAAEAAIKAVNVNREIDTLGNEAPRAERGGHLSAGRDEDRTEKESMTIQEQLNEDLKAAMKGHDEVTKDTVRLIRSAVRNAEIEKGAALDDAGVIDVLSRMAKQYRDSIATYRNAGRQDLVDKEEGELAVVMRYLPEQMDAEEVRTIARQTAEEVSAQGPQDKGKVMGRLMPKVKGRADGAMVNQVVTELLDSIHSS